MHYNANYVVKDNDVFIPQNFPFVEEELLLLMKDTYMVADQFKQDIVVSYVKNHSILVTWSKANTALVTLLTSGSIKIHHLEALFGASVNNKPFQDTLEQYIKAVMQEGIKQHA